MKQFFKLTLFTFIGFYILQFAVVCLAQVDPAPLIPAMPAADDFQKLFDSFGNAKGAGVMFFVAAGVQIVIGLLKSKLGSFAGHYQVLAVSTLTVVAGVLALTLSGVSIKAALFHAVTLNGFQSLLYDYYKQLFVKKAIV